MAVYDHKYQLYKGPFTPVALRFLMVPRYAFKRVFASKLFTAFFVLCFLPFLIFGGGIYLMNNVGVLEMLNIKVGNFMTIDTAFFIHALNIQLGLSFLLTLFVGPPLISPDLANNALPLYLSRPFERRDYVLGKFMVIYILNASVTWVSSIFLFLLQAYMAGGEWAVDHFQIVIGIFLGANLYIISITLFALALSAWLKWKTVAGFAFITLPFMATAVGESLSGILNMPWGQYLNHNKVFSRVFSWLFETAPENTLAVGGCLALIIFVCLGSLLLLRVRIKAYEVVR